MIEQPRNGNRLPVAARRRDAEVYEVSSPEPSQKSGTNLLVVAWRRRWIVLGCLVIALMCGIAYVLRAQPVYSSSSVIYVQSAVPKILSDEITSGGDSSDYLYTQSQLIQSTAILAGAMDVPGVADAECLHGVDNPVGYLKAHVSAQPSKQGDFIVVAMESPDPQSAATIVNGVVQSYIDYQTRVHQSTAVEVVQILQKNFDQHEAELKAAQNAMLDLQRQNPDFVFQASDSAPDHSRVGQMSEELSNAQVRVLDLTTALAAATAARNNPTQLHQILNEYHLEDLVSSGPDPASSLSSQCDQEQQSLDAMMDRLGARNQAVIEQRRKVERLKQEVATNAQQQALASVAAIQQALATAQQRVKQLQDAIANERQSTVSMTAKQIQFQQYAQEAQRAQRELDLLDSRMKEINPTEDIGSLTVTVLESAKPVLVPVRPNRAQAVEMSIAAGLILGLGLAMLRETLDQRVRSAEEVSHLLNLPVLGAVPHIPKQTGPSSVRGQETAFRPRSDIAEAFRTIRTAIYFGAYDSRLLKTVLLTSPTVGDGKSTSSSNLAIAVSHAGRRVLLIDADCRRPSQHKIFNLDAQTGLSDVLTDKAAFKDAVKRCVHERLDVLPCGPVPPHPAELLDSKAFIELLKSVSSEYDHVFIDSPPVIPVSDARVISAFCDATILVLRAQQSTRRMAEHACQMLDSVGARILGVIMNDTPRGRRGYPYQYAGYGSYVDEDDRTPAQGARLQIPAGSARVEPDLMDED